MRVIAGALAVGVLNVLGRLPTTISLGIGFALLPLYVPFRFRTRAKLRRLGPRVDVFGYYRMRLRLTLLSVKHALSLPDGCETKVKQGGFFADALSSGKPVLLLGWHQGPVEWLHEIPAKASAGCACFVMTASAFSPVLADWMARGRERGGVTVVRPGETDALRRWARDGGVLAVMADQVPGKPEAWLPLPRTGVQVPWPGRLVDWAVARNPEILAVSAQLEDRNRIVFRYDRIAPDSVKDSIGALMDDALGRAPEQYNWSYGKIRIR